MQYLLPWHVPSQNLPWIQPLFVDIVADPPANVLRPYPDVFWQADDVLAFSPTSGRFESQTNHHVLRCFSMDEADMQAAGTDVFLTSWTAELFPYFCPPWTEITPMLAKVVDEGLTCMAVLHERPHAQWWSLFELSRIDWLCCMELLPSLNVASSAFLAPLDPVCFQPHWTTVFALEIVWC